MVKPSSRCASRGWWRTAGGRLCRCAAATGRGGGGAGVLSSALVVALLGHSAYSFLDGVSLPQELAQRAGELGYDALALTDHNSVSGSMELAVIASEHGVRAIHGAEIDVTLDAG